MKKLLLLCFLLCAFLQGWANEWTDSNGITWYYTRSGSNATITGASQTSGDLMIPSKVNGYTVTAIGDEAFNSCEELTNVTFPSSVTKIGQDAFNYCVGLTSITLPEGLKSIGGGAFFDCESLTSVSIPSTVTSISKYAFGGYSSITSINVASGNTVYDSRNNCNAIIKTSTNTLIQGCPSTIIPSSVTIIGDGAFFNNFKITDVTIPEGVTSIGAEAFFGCNLRHVVIPSTVTSIGDAAFSDILHLEEVVSYIQQPFDISEGTFPVVTESGIKTTLYVPSGTKSLYLNAAGWSLFKEIVTIGPNYYTFNVNGEEATITGCERPKGDLEIPSQVSNGQMVYNVTAIDDEAFRDCTDITSVTIPSSVKNIGEYAFGSCSSLANVNLTDGLTKIGFGAFEDCSNLTDITIPESVTCIEGTAFSSTSFFENLPDGLVYFNNILYQYKGTMPSNTNIVIKDGTVSISSWAFMGCVSMTDVVIPESVTTIGSLAFSGCSGLTTISLPSSVTTIYEGAFSCDNLINVYCYATTPPNIIGWGCSGFSNRAKSTLYVPSGCKEEYKAATEWKDFKEIIEMATEENIWTFTTNGSNATITGCSQPEGDLDIPNVVTKNGNEYHVTAIGEAAFSGCTGLISVTIPEGVTNIYKTAFNGCTNLTSIIIPGSVTNIGTSAFANCSSLTNMVLPEGLKTIGENAFKQCTALKNITIPSTLETLAKYAFSYCSGLKKVIVSDLAAWCGVTFGDGNANPLNYSHHLYSDEETEITELVIPEGVTVINARAFRGCSSLKSVTIPSSVTSIGDYAFFNCSSLATVSCDMDTPLSITANTFSNRANATLYVPAGCKSLYEDADYWKEFKEIIEMGTVSLIEQIVLGKTALNLSVGEATTLTVTITPEDATNQELVWTSSDTNVATVENGVITAIGIGTAIITVTANDGSGVSASCQVTVTEAAEEDTDYSQIDNTIYIERTEGITGQQVTLSIKMKNTAEIQGYQFDLVLPNGVTVATDEDGFSLIELSTARTTARKTDYFNATVQPDGSIRVLCGSSKGYTFEGTDGEVATITLNISEDMAEGDHPIILKEVNLTDKNSTLYTTDYLKSTLTIINFILGDVNGNKKVEVSDFIATANYILGNPPQVFIFKAGDVNSNNKIEVADFIGIANIILNGSGSNNAPTAAPKKALAAGPKRASTDIEALSDAIYVEPVTASPGTQQVLSVRMKNSSPVAGFEFRLQLPDGITVATDEDGILMAELSTARTTARKTDYFNSSLQDDGTLQVLCGTSTADPSTGKTYVFSGNEGEVAQITVNIPEDYAEGVYEVSILDAAFSDADNNLKEVGQTVTTELTIGDNSIVLDENSTEEIAATDGPVKVVVKRTLKKDQWSTICLPFDMTEEQVYAAFGDDVQLQEFDSYDAEYDADDNVTSILVHFTDADLSDGFYGNYPYVIKVSEDISEFTVTTTINPLEDDCYSEYDNGRTGKNRHVYGTFYGTYHAQTTVPENCLFISDNKFWYSTGLTKMKAFRGYFELEDVLSDAANANINFTFDGTTGIRDIRSQSLAEGAVYTIQGQYLGKDIDLKKLPRGIYIVNGKKQVIK